MLAMDQDSQRFIDKWKRIPRFTPECEVEQFRVTHMEMKVITDDTETFHSNSSLQMEVIFEMCEDRTPNDDRSDSLNDNNAAYQASLDNHSMQLNPNNERYQGK